MPVSKKVADRISQQVRKYQGILSDAKNRDVSESDTVIIIVDMLSEILGYKKHVEITTEFAIRGTFVDLAVKVGEDVRFLIEAKAIGVDLKDAHVKQAIDYGANHGIEWIVLTNGIRWRVYKIHFRKPIDKSVLFEIDLLQCNPRSPQTVECLGNLSREGFAKPAMTAFYEQQQATSKFSLAALVLSDAMVSTMRRELRRISPGIRVEEEDLRAVLRNDVLKREVVDSDEAKAATDWLRRGLKALARSKLRAKPGPAEVTEAGISMPITSTATDAEVADTSSPRVADP